MRPETNTTKQIQGGTIKAYAVTSPQRLKIFPDLPTAEEAGLSGFQVGIWHGIYAPKGTPAEVTDRLSKSCRRRSRTRTSSPASVNSAPSRQATPTRRRRR